MHYGKIRYITQSKDRVEAFTKLVRERNLKTHDLTLILSTIGFNPEHFHYFKTEEERLSGTCMKLYLYQDDPFKELNDPKL